MTTAPAIDPDLRRYVVCPRCDALHRAADLAKGQVASCRRCHAVLAAPRRKAGALIVALALATLILIGTAIFFPFLQLEVRGFRSSASLLDIALAFSQGTLLLLVALTLALVIAIPAARAALLIYVIWPLVRDRPPARHAPRAFLWAAHLRPWAMAEVFAIGCAVALIKITDLALVDLGQAFWMFSSLVALGVIQDRFLCNWSVWNALSPRHPR